MGSLWTPGLSIPQRHIIPSSSTVGAADDVIALLVVAAGIVWYLFCGILWNKPNAYYHLWFERRQQAGGNTETREYRNIAERIRQDVRNALVQLDG